MFNTILYSLPLLGPFYGTKMVTISLWGYGIEISISYDQDAFNTFILSITGSPAFNGCEVSTLLNS